MEKEFFRFLGGYGQTPNIETSARSKKRLARVFPRKLSLGDTEGTKSKHRQESPLAY